MVDVLPLAQSTVSQHLRRIVKAVLINGETDGPRSCWLYQLESSFVKSSITNSIFFSAT
ncbi:MAG: hypothetical protein IPK57_15610 [Chitinophagaceae bacterium]|nr:hypothetical protein [Chitinophagaceae bacterium]